VAIQVPPDAPRQPPSFAAVEFPPLLSAEPDPAWELGVYAQFVVLKHFRDLLTQRQVVWDNQDVEGVHHIRVAARRCRTALQTFGALWDAAEVQRFQKYLSRFADTFGISRDLDVMLIFLRGQLATAHGERRAAYSWLFKRNAEKRKAEQSKLESVLLKLESDGFPKVLAAYFSRTPVDLWPMELHRG
jgi:CHAD domain-containing protein